MSSISNIVSSMSSIVSSVSSIVGKGRRLKEQIKQLWQEDFVLADGV